MNTISSSADTDRLRDILNTCYPIHVDPIHLHRDMISYVYIAESAAVHGTKKYVLKRVHLSPQTRPLRTVKD